MGNGNMMGRRQFFSKFFPALTETIVEQTKDETKVIYTNSSAATQAIIHDQTEVVGATEESSGMKFPWVGM